MIKKTQIELVSLYRRNGVLRVPNAKKRATLGELYKKGYEVRLVAFTKGELKRVRRQLKQEGYRLGRPFAKGRRLVQPIYGREEVQRFLEMVSTVKKLTY